MFDKPLQRRTVLKGALAGLASLSLVSLPGRLWAAPGKTLRIALSAAPTTVDPHLQSNAPNNALATHIFDSLVVNDAKSQSVPGLASSWRIVDDTHWVFQLRPDVTFSDGAPLTADDIIASINRATNLPSTASFRTYTQTIKSMAAGENNQLLIETRAPDPLLPNSLSRIRIIAAKYKDAPSSDFNNGKAAIGTGPFVLVEYVPGNKVVLKRNEPYWGDAFPYEHVELQVISDEAARLAALLSGSFDLIEEMPYHGIKQVESSGRFHIQRGISSRVVYLAMDQQREVTPFIKSQAGQPLEKNPLKDPRVRRALSLAINRAGIVKQVMDGNAQPAAQFLPNGAPGTSPDIQVDSYDPAAAKALLAEAGYPEGFQLTLHGSNDRYINDAKIVQAIAQMFSRIGVKTQVDVMPWSVYSGHSSKAEFSVSLASWGVNTGETSNPITATVATYDKSKGMGSSNYGRYSNPAVDEKLLIAKATMDDGKRNALLAEISHLLFTDHAILPLHFEAVVVGARKGVNYTPRADQYTLAMGVSEA
ncbi:Putative substrate-binding component of ABC transporter [Sodalis praecaptivus]|uniref:Putative substrate-binding component of ABC transporter n=1 Tax=Sodalis praecaptivus TaxID=1239307 RepID=W0HPN5_9GAMM|nr:ABC transporter substrate-binding protein [Sodalis praecaptivus]AHF75784.1 Putative substrate-binding component of ABC transporter [Sodalis praecaptivus]